MMAGLLNKWSDYVVDGEPAAIGLVPVGDAVLCTNPLYGRGCSTAYWSAHLLATAVAEHGDDPRALASPTTRRCEPRSIRGIDRRSSRIEKRDGWPQRCWWARIPTAMRQTRGRSPGRSCVTDWPPHCEPIRWCCGHS